MSWRTVKGRLSNSILSPSNSRRLISWPLARDALALGVYFAKFGHGDVEQPGHVIRYPQVPCQESRACDQPNQQDDQDDGQAGRDDQRADLDDVLADDDATRASPTSPTTTSPRSLRLKRAGRRSCRGLLSKALLDPLDGDFAGHADYLAYSRRSEQARKGLCDIRNVIQQPVPNLGDRARAGLFFFLRLGQLAVEKLELELGHFCSVGIQLRLHLSSAAVTAAILWSMICLSPGKGSPSMSCRVCVIFLPTATPRAPAPTVPIMTSPPAWAGILSHQA